VVFLCHNFLMKNAKYNKDKLRKPLLQQRSLLSTSEQKKMSAQIIEHIKKSDAFKQSRKIAFYHAVRGEANPAGLQQCNAGSDKNTDSFKQFYLPILSPNKGQGLVFAPINKHTQYKKNTFSIPEPIVDSYELINAEELDLVIMPLLGFDLAGNRLGMGGGYYDRCFAFKQLKPKNPVLMGFAYDFQQLDEINAEPWDISLDMIATESVLRNL